VVGSVSFADHHKFSPQDMRRLEELAEQSGAELLLTTGKDVVRLPDGAGQVLPAGTGPLASASCTDEKGWSRPAGDATREARGNALPIYVLEVRLEAWSRPERLEAALEELLG